MKKSPIRKLHVVQVPGYLYGFESMTDIAAMLKLLDKAIPLEYDKQSRVQGFTDQSEDREHRIACEMNQPYRPRQEALALPERGTHPALYDPKLA